MADVDTDKNLLFGVIALQSDLIDMQQFVDGCTLWSSRKEVALADVLIQQGWLLSEDRKHVEYLLDRRLKRDGRTPKQTLAAIPVDLKAALAKIDDQSIQRSIQGKESGAPTQRAPMPGAAPQLREKITLKGLHSSGGIGQVWVAYDEILGREVALKELKPDMAVWPANRERFLREAQLTGQLEHPGIVPVYELATHEGTLRTFYTMRFVKGRTLTEAIRTYHEQRNTSSSASTMSELIGLLNTFVSICHTIAYAHSRHVIHRDLKGENIILGDFGEVIVLDWGLAKRLDEPSAERRLASAQDPRGTMVSSEEFLKSPAVTMQGDKLGTPSYMAPEQAKGQNDEIDERTDVYGLGAILYEVLTGHAPFEGNDVGEILQRVALERPKAPSEQVTGVPLELERICLQGLAKERGDRQQSALELANQVQGWIVERAERKRTDQERERFFNLSLDLLAILDAQGTLTQTNPAWKDVLGWTRGDLDAMTIWEILRADEHERFSQSLCRIRSGESLAAVEHRCLCKDGSSRWVLWNASFIAGEESIYIVGRDITERKQTEQTFQELLESAPDGMVIVDDSGKIVLANAQLQRMFDYSREEMLGNQIEMLVPEQIRAKHPAYVRQFIDEPAFRPMGSALKLHGRA